MATEPPLIRGDLKKPGFGREQSGSYTNGGKRKREEKKNYEQNNESEGLTTGERKETRSFETQSSGGYGGEAKKAQEKVTREYELTDDQKTDRPDVGKITSETRVHQKTENGDGKLTHSYHYKYPGLEPVDKESTTPIVGGERLEVSGGPAKRTSEEHTVPGVSATGGGGSWLTAPFSFLAGIKEGLSASVGGVADSLLNGTVVDDAKGAVNGAWGVASDPLGALSNAAEGIAEGYEDFKDGDLNEKAEMLGEISSGFLPLLGWAGRASRARTLLQAADKIEDAAGETLEKAAKSSNEFADAGGDVVADKLRIQNKAQQARDTAPTRGLGGRSLTPAQRAELNTFADRARARGYVENPHRTGSFGDIVDGKFKERVRIDIGDPSQPGWRGKTHLNFPGDRGHYPTDTPLP